MKEKVMVYDCEVRLGGSVMHTLTKQGVSQREMRVLRALHGEDAVVGVTERGEQEIDQREEAFELALRYSKTSNPRHGRTLIERVLNVDMSGFDKWLQERDQLAEMERQERREKQQAEAATFARHREAAEARARAEIANRQAGITEATA